MVDCQRDFEAYLNLLKRRQLAWWFHDNDLEGGGEGLIVKAGRSMERWKRN